MSLPKDFDLINQRNREKALSDLKWFIFYYDYELTDEYSKFINEGFNKWGLIVDELGSHRVYATTESSAIEMFHNYMDTMYIVTGKILQYGLKYKGCEEGKCGVTIVLH